MRYARNLAWMCLTLLLLAGIATAQDAKKEKESPLRTVKGVVADKSDDPLQGSVVFLKNTRTNAVRSTFADSDGSYRFSGLDPNADYEVRAEFEGAKSPVKTVSSLDNRKEIVLNLKIDRKKS
jgi:Carboxypeptidase regulatory-like domain